MNKPPDRDPFGDGAPDAPPEPVTPITAELFFEVLREYEKSVANPPSVSEAPIVALEDWQIYRVDGVERAIGWSPLFCDGCISGPIIEFSLDGRKGRTESGRIYVLSGFPGRSPEAQRVLGWSVRKWNSSQVVEVTREYDAHQQRAQP